MADQVKNPSVAVIILTYGNFAGLMQTLESVSVQTYLPKTVIVSDDGSGQYFAPELVAQFPKMIFRQNEKNLGTVAHMNAAAALTQSDYVKFLASGDAFSDIDALDALVEFAQITGAVAVTSHAQVCDERLQHSRYQFPGKHRSRRFQCDAAALFQRLAATNLVSAAGTLLRRVFFDRMGGFDEEYHLLEDWPTWLRLTREGQMLPLLNRVTCLYGVGGVSSEYTDAFGSPALKRDMLHCYEKEILPYLGRFDEKNLLRVRYGYDQLRGLTPDELLIKYGRLEYMTRWKRKIKTYLFK